jgi:two-component system cell cycle response regulator DivK
MYYSTPSSVPPVSAAAKPGHTSSRGGPKRILIVEDNDLNLKLFRDLLGANGYETIETKEGYEAINLARNLRPDLILMDIQLPEISGLEVTKRIKADVDIRHIPIIAVTAFAMKDDEEKILRAGCEEYISKPISIAEFLAAVKRFLNVEVTGV